MKKTELLQRIEALEQRVRALEARPVFPYVYPVQPYWWPSMSPTTAELYPGVLPHTICSDHIAASTVVLDHALRNN
jgi:hypothetical protein